MAGSTIFVSRSDLSSKQVRSAKSIGHNPHTVGAAEFQVLSQELFRDALVRERRRADRFDEAFAVVLFTLIGETARESRWSRLAIAISQATAGSDVTGWYQHGTTLGLIRPAADSVSPETATTVAARVQRELERYLNPEDLNSCSIRCETYSPVALPSPLLEAASPRKPQHVARDVAKRLLDIVGSAVLLIALSPVFLLVSALVKLTSRGPVLFPQERIGSGGRPFTMMKFRTMQVNADPKVHQQYVEDFIQSGKGAAIGGRVFKIVNDPRVTPIGHFLRRSSLDELPQFWNVLIGEMSLVGPRPPLPYEVARYKNWHRRRLVEAKPGLTGLWQVTGRSRTTFDEMVRLDLRYAKNCSVWTDLKILAATPKAVISGKGAH